MKNNNLTLYRDIISPVFDLSKPGIYTFLCGISNIKYEQHTRVSRHIHAQILGILDHIGIKYYLFAGSLVGYVRNMAPPAWLDDLDIMIFEDQIESFIDYAVPALERCGFRCFQPRGNLKGGGYHILGMQQNINSRDHYLSLAEGMDVRVPWAQVDVFFSYVDSNGFIRNPSSWGLYDKKNISVDLVGQGTFVEIEGEKRRVFNKFEEDIIKEYGDVFNNVVIASHGKIFLDIKEMPWHGLLGAHDEIIQETTSPIPPEIRQKDISSYIQEVGKVAEIPSNQSFAFIIQKILSTRAESVRLYGDDNIFWVADIRRIFPKIKIEVFPESQLGINRVAHLRIFIDMVHHVDLESKEMYKECMRSLALSCSS